MLSEIFLTYQWRKYHFPRNDSIYSRNENLITLVAREQYLSVEKKITEATSDDLHNPMLLNEILHIVLCNYKSLKPEKRLALIGYMLSLEPLVDFIKIMPNDINYLQLKEGEGDAWVIYTSICSLAARTEDFEMMDLLIDKLGIELIVASDAIEHAIQLNRTKMIQTILGRDHRFAQQEIESIIYMCDGEHNLKPTIFGVGNHCNAYFNDLRYKKTSFLSSSKQAFLPTFTRYIVKGVDKRLLAVIAAGAALWSYSRVRASM